MVSITPALYAIIAVFALHVAYCDEAKFTVFILKEEAVKKIVAVRLDGKPEYIAILPTNGEPSISRGAEIKNTHIILNNFEGRITLNFISCIYGVSFAAWANGSPILLERVKEGITEDEKSGSFFARFSVLDLGQLPNDKEGMLHYGPEEIRRHLPLPEIKPELLP